jgi:hypothetical protein
MAENEEGFLSRIMRLGKFAARGAALPFESPKATETPEQWEKRTGRKAPIIGGKKVVPIPAPVGLELIPSGLYNLYKLGVEATGNKPYINKTLEGMSTRVEGAYDNLGEKLGIGDPSNPYEVGAEVIGSVLFPGPKRVPKVSTVIKAAPKTATKKVAAAATKTIKVVGDTAKETLIPFRQGQSLTKAVAVQAPLAIGAMEAVDYASKDAEYNSLINQVTGKSDETVVAASKRDLTEFIPEDLTPMFAQAIAENDDATLNFILDEATKRQQEAIHRDYIPAEPDWKDGAITVGALAATGLGIYGVRRYSQQFAKQRLLGTTGLGGQADTPEFTSPKMAFDQGVFQSDQTLREAAKWYTKSNEQLEEVYAKLDRVTEPSLNTIVTHTVKTGDLPNSAIRSRPIGPTLQAFSQELDQVEQKMVGDALLAQTALDDFKSTGKFASFSEITDPTTGVKRPTTEADLNNIISLVRNDAKLNKYVDYTTQWYRDILDYRLEQGDITQTTYNDMITKRPNYVALQRNVKQRDQGIFRQTISPSGLDDRDPMYQRSEDVFGGVQQGAVVDPIRMLPDIYANTIKDIEKNKVRVDILEASINHPYLSGFFKKLPPGEVPKGSGAKNYIETKQNGISQWYKVDDPHLQEAIRLTPYATKSIIPTFIQTINKVRMFQLTGAGNPFFGGSAMFYDTMVGVINRPKGVDLGLINEGINRAYLAAGKTKGPIAKTTSEILSRFDPTVYAGAPIGALRILNDKFVEGVANSITTELTKDNSWLVQSLGLQNVKALEQRFASAFIGSTKSWMDEYGADTSTYFNNAQAHDINRAMADIAPKFYNDQSYRAYIEALNENTGTVETLMKGSANAFERARANPIARLYLSTVRAMHEGWRYQTAATNLPKVIGDDAASKLLASKVRRISADIGQTGASQIAQDANKSIIYLNVGIQSLAETGRRFAKDPVNTSMNLASLAIMSIAAQYGMALLNPENAKTVRDMTDEQQARTIKTFGGLEIPVEPNFRPIWATITSIMNEITGINSGNLNRDIAEAIDNWIDNDFQLSESGQSSLQESLRSAVDTMNPAQLGSIPVVAAGGAAMGFDIGLSRFTGKSQELQQQEIVSGDKGRLVDDSLSARTQKMIQELAGNVIASFVRAGLDANRAYSDYPDFNKSVDVALSRIKDEQIKSSGMAKETLFAGYDRLENVNDTDFKLFYKKKAGIEAAVETLNKDIRGRNLTGVDPKTAQLRNIDFVLPEYRNTALMPIGAISHELDKNLRNKQKELNLLKKQIESTRNQKFSKIEERNRQENEYNKQRKELTSQMLNYIRMAEDRIREEIQDSTFSYQTFSKDQYKKVPYPPPLVTPPQVELQ